MLTKRLVSSTSTRARPGEGGAEHGTKSTNALADYLRIELRRPSPRLRAKVATQTTAKMTAPIQSR